MVKTVYDPNWAAKWSQNHYKVGFQKLVKIIFATVEPRALLIRKLFFCQKVTVHKYQKPFIGNLKKPACPSKQDMLELATLR